MFRPTSTASHVASRTPLRYTPNINSTLIRTVGTLQTNTSIFGALPHLLSNASFLFLVIVHILKTKAALRTALRKRPMALYVFLSGKQL
jgi:hypothetical protein